MVRFLATTIVLLGSSANAEEENWAVHQSYEYNAAYRPDTNPGKGFVPYPGSYTFPHSMEYRYFGFADLMPEEDTFDFQEVEGYLEACASRGNQGVFRVYFDYPDNETSVPQFLIDAGVSLTVYTDHGGGESPDYDHPALVAAAQDLITALGSTYDGDPRIATIQVGLLGHWGEWHTWPRDDLFPSHKTQMAVLQQFGSAFSQTPILVSQDSLAYEPTHSYGTYELGFHDDAFAEGTLGPDEWMFVPRLQRLNLTQHWKTLPIGGEILPSLQSIIWDVPSGATQDYGECVTATHASWLLNHGAFNNNWSSAKRARAVEGSKQLGYDLFVENVNLTKEGEELAISLTISNRGVAPFYRAWPLILDLDGASPISHQLTVDLSQVLPGEPITYVETLPIPMDLAKPETVTLRAIKPDPRLKPFRFSNPGYDDDRLVISLVNGTATAGMAAEKRPSLNKND